MGHMMKRTGHLALIAFVSACIGCMVVTVLAQLGIVQGVLLRAFEKVGIQDNFALRQAISGGLAIPVSWLLVQLSQETNIGMPTCRNHRSMLIVVALLYCALASSSWAGAAVDFLGYQIATERDSVFCFAALVAGVFACVCAYRLLGNLRFTRAIVSVSIGGGWMLWQLFWTVVILRGGTWQQ